MKPDLGKIPSDPGIYQFYNAVGEIIYIGKAKNLKKRVSSYWAQSNGLEPAKQEMLIEVDRVEYVAVDNESEALLLEAGLIKKYLPRYNVAIRDDKSWTYIVITAEPFPRILTVHGRTKQKGEYFGPFTRAAAAKTVVKLLHRILPLRTCARDLHKLPNGLVCMQYHLGNCLGPCEEKVGADAYLKLIQQARSVLKGDTKLLKREFEKAMRESARLEHYEQAAVYRNKLKALQALIEPQQVVHPLLADHDIIAIANGGEQAVITCMQARGGQLLDTLHFKVDNGLRLSSEEVLEQFLAQRYGQALQRPKELVVPFPVRQMLERALRPIRIRKPQRGTRKKLLAMAEKNAWLYYGRLTRGAPISPLLYRLKDILELPEVPERIEAYDISNISGEYAVGAMVVALNAKLTPSHYRKFKIKTVLGPNDVQMMREMVSRRQNHPEWPEPQLIVLDGGKPQLSTVYPILKPEWQNRVVALAKKEELLFLPGRSQGIHLSKKDEALLLLRRIRDAVHNQAIRYYRLTHKKQWKKR